MIDAAVRCSRLFDLLRVALDGGARFARVTEVDQLVADQSAAIILKHDIHAVPLAELERFATQQAELGILGSYFFMAPDHPLTAPAYSFADQCQSMRTIETLGHEVGLHIDPFFLIDTLAQPLAIVLEQTIEAFAEQGIVVRCGNMHGNSKYKMLDRSGFGTSFDLFAELGRQPDYPTLADVPAETASLIRANRLRLADFGITHWADMPLWSAQHGYVVTNYITDNQLARRDAIEVNTREHTLGGYQLADRQPPGSRTPSEPREFVPCKSPAARSELPTGSFTVDFDSDELEDWLRRLSGHPTLFLVHPQHYV